MGIPGKIKRAFRGRVTLSSVLLETARHGSAALRESYERLTLSKDAEKSLPLAPEFARMSPGQLQAHFRERETPNFFRGFDLSTDVLAQLHRERFPAETETVLAAARDIVARHRWPLLGYGAIDFGKEIDWLREPVSRVRWLPDYHHAIELIRGDGSDIRVLWELNRLGHLLTLGRAFAVTNDEKFAEECFSQLESWQAQNPFGYGPNWTCAMEVSLRAINLIAALQMTDRARAFTEKRCTALLTMLAQHGEYIRRHLEFSYIATSNHYLCDVAGLLWLGVMLPELESAHEWREFGLRETFDEMNKQVLADGADYEASTGYHRLKAELFLFSFVLCHSNGIDVPEAYWNKLRRMLEYTRAYVRPDGRAPLIGDADGSRVMPLARHAADDHAYLLGLGAAVFHEPRFKTAIGSEAPELLWVLGEQGLRDYEALPTGETAQSQAFPDAGTYILCDRDLYLLFNASGNGMNGRGSHGHNDALSVEVSACGTPFIIDPGAYVYTSDLRERHRFRSTAYHSSVQVDDAEQNSIDKSEPFVIGDEDHPRVLEWETGPVIESVAAEHYGYQRLRQPVVHRRRVLFNKQKRYWFIDDKLSGEGEHDLAFRFHFAPGLETVVRPDGFLELRDAIGGARLLILAGELNVAGAQRPQLEARFSSRNYGAKKPSVSACWFVRAALPFGMQFVITPIGAQEDEGERLGLVMDFNN